MSNFFEWDAGKYALHIPMIDDEHQQIIAAMNELHSAYMAQAPKARLGEIFAQLRKVTVDHFRDEEAYMERIGYEDLRKHRHVHAHLLQRLDAFAADFRSTGKLTDELFLFLKMWLKSHICGIDAKYAEHAAAA